MMILEWEKDWMSQIATSNKVKMGIRKLPFLSLSRELKCEASGDTILTS